MKVKVLKIRLSEKFQIPDEEIVNDYLKRYDVINMNAKLINDEINYWSIMIYYKDKSKISSSKFYVEAEEELSEGEKIIYNELKKWRFKKSKEYGLPAFMICYNTELMLIAKYKPISIKELFEIKGFKETKVNKYGKEIIEILENV